MPAQSGDLTRLNIYVAHIWHRHRLLFSSHFIPRDISVCWPEPNAGTDTSEPVTATLEVRSVPETNLRAVSAGHGSGPVLHTDHVLVKSGKHKKHKGPCKKNMHTICSSLQPWAFEIFWYQPMSKDCVNAGLFVNIETFFAVSRVRAASLIVLPLLIHEEQGSLGYF